MGNFRPIAGFGAALLTVVATGCLSAEESLFRAVDAPAQAAEDSSASGVLEVVEVMDLTRVPEALPPCRLRATGGAPARGARGGTGGVE